MHLKAVKQILRYLKGTILFGLIYTKGENDEELAGYTDSDLAAILTIGEALEAWRFILTTVLCLGVHINRELWFSHLLKQNTWQQL